MVDVALAMGHLDGDAASQRDVALTAEEALRRHVDGHQRGGAGGLHVYAGAAQVHQVRDAGGEEIFVVAGVAQQEKADGGDQFRVGEQVIGHVSVMTRAAKNANCPFKTLWIITGMLQRCPRHL